MSVCSAQNVLILLRHEFFAWRERSYPRARGGSAILAIAACRQIGSGENCMWRIALSVALILAVAIWIASFYFSLR